MCGTDFSLVNFIFFKEKKKIFSDRTPTLSKGKGLYVV